MTRRGSPRSRETLYSLSKEGRGSCAALVTALTLAVCEAAEELAKRSPAGRLPVPMVVVLDEAANVCRWRKLPELYSHYGSRGICLMTILQSWSQGVEVWGKDGMSKLWSAATIKVYGGGVSEVEFLEQLSRLIGDFDLESRSLTHASRGGGRSVNRSVRRERILDVADLGALPGGPRGRVRLGRQADPGAVDPVDGRAATPGACARRSPPTTPQTEVRGERLRGRVGGARRRGERRATARGRCWHRDHGCARVRVAGAVRRRLPAADVPTGGVGDRLDVVRGVVAPSGGGRAPGGAVALVGVPAPGPGARHLELAARPRRPPPARCCCRPTGRSRAARPSDTRAGRSRRCPRRRCRRACSSGRQGRPARWGRGEPVRRATSLFAGGFVLALGVVFAVVLIGGSVAEDCAGASASDVSTAGQPPLVQYYLAAAQRYGLGADGYAYLAAINYVETSFGTDLSTSSAGAEGWMQFEPATWQQWGVSVTSPGSPPDPDDPQDAIYAAARYLQASGAPGDWSAAIFAYNHADWYVAEVQAQAARYSGPSGLVNLNADIRAAWGGREPTGLPSPTTVFASGSAGDGTCCPGAGSDAIDSQAASAYLQDLGAAAQGRLRGGERERPGARAAERRDGGSGRVDHQGDAARRLPAASSATGPSTPTRRRTWHR